MDLRQLNALLAVADHGSFSAAARALHTVQSNVSTHVARLEKELGAVLIDRASGQLTDDGEVVAGRARRIQAELEAIVADVAALHDVVTGTVRLGIIGTTARWLVPPLVEAMAERHPKVRLVVVDATTSSLVLQLGSGRLDLAVVNLPLPDPDLVTEADRIAEMKGQRRPQPPRFDLDYVAVVDADTFAQERELGPRSLLVAAARLGLTRLIDNLELAPVAAPAGVQRAAAGAAGSALSGASSTPSPSSAHSAYPTGDATGTKGR